MGIQAADRLGGFLHHLSSSNNKPQAADSPDMTEAAPLSSDARESFNKDFAFLKYGRSPPDEKHPALSVNGNAFWSYCGPLIDPAASKDPESSLPANFFDFTTETFTGPLLCRLVPFLAFIKTLLLSRGLHHYLLTVRASIPTHEFDRPRWHSDELFFTTNNDGVLPGTRIGVKSEQKNRKRSDDTSGTNWKICTTLLGPSTMFVPLRHQASARTKQEAARLAASTDHTCLSIRCVGCASAADAVRHELDQTLAQFSHEAAEPGECAVFKVGRDSGAIHSEPCMSEGTDGRIFVNVIPGTEDELKSLLERWGMEFPRQWWIQSI